MFCSNCGSQLPDGTDRCPKCGFPLSGSSKMQDGINNATNAAQNAFGQAEQELGNAFRDVQQSFNGQQIPPRGNGPVKTDRSLLTYILLTIVTCGIYGFYFQYTIARDVNNVLGDDGEQTAGLVAYIFLSLITCGIYSYIWLYKLGNRLAANAPRFGLNFQENGTTILMWNLFGSLLCCIGPFIAMHILIKNTNAICMAYNRSHGYM